MHQKNNLILYIILFIFILPTYAGAEEAASGQELIVYYDHNDQNNQYFPSFQIGDQDDITIDENCKFNPQSGQTCLKAEYRAKGSEFGWSGLYWVRPSGNWGEIDAGLDLTFATKLTFWAKGEKGGEKIAVFKYGGIKNICQDSDNHGIGPVELTDKWQEYTIDLSKRNLKYIISGFCFQVSKMHNPEGATFYIDNIKYQK